MYLFHSPEKFGRFMWINELRYKLKHKFRLIKKELPVLAENNILLCQSNQELDYKIDNYARMNVLKDCKEPYVIFLNDNLIYHQDLKYYLERLEFALTNKFWKLIYLNSSDLLSSSYRFDLIPVLNSDIDPLAVVIHSDIFKYLSEDYNLDKIMDNYPFECFMSNIPLFRTNFIKFDDFKYPKMYPVFILAKNQSLRLSQSLEFMKMFDMLLDPIILHIGVPDKKTKKVLSGTSHIIVHSFDEIFRFVKDKSQDFFILTSIFINWSLDIPKNIINYSINLLKNNSKIDACQPSIGLCPRCSNNIIIEDYKFKYFDQDISEDPVEFLICRKDLDFYKIKVCQFNLRFGYLYNIKSCINNLKYEDLNDEYHFRNISDIRSELEYSLMFENELNWYWYETLSRLETLSLEKILEWWRVHILLELEKWIYGQILENYQVNNSNIYLSKKYKSIFFGPEFNSTNFLMENKHKYLKIRLSLTKLLNMIKDKNPRILVDLYKLYLKNTPIVKIYFS